MSGRDIYLDSEFHLHARRKLVCCCEEHIPIFSAFFDDEWFLFELFNST